MNQSIKEIAEEYIKSVRGAPSMGWRLEEGMEMWMQGVLDFTRHLDSKYKLTEKTGEDYQNEVITKPLDSKKECVGCGHEICKACGYCHNDDCERHNSAPSKACWDTLKPQKESTCEHAWIPASPDKHVKDQICLYCRVLKDTLPTPKSSPARIEEIKWDSISEFSESGKVTAIIAVLNQVIRALNTLTKGE